MLGVKELWEEAGGPGPDGQDLHRDPRQQRAQRPLAWKEGGRVALFQQGVEERGNVGCWQQKKSCYPVGRHAFEEYERCPGAIKWLCWGMGHQGRLSQSQKRLATGPVPCFCTLGAAMQWRGGVMEKGKKLMEKRGEEVGGAVRDEHASYPGGFHCWLCVIGGCANLFACFQIRSRLSGSKVQLKIHAMCLCLS